MSRQRARAPSVGLAMLLVACTRWEPVPTPVASTELPPSIKVWSSDGAHTVLNSPFVRQDTLYGRSQGDTVGVALDRIDRAARPRLDAAKSAGTFVGGLAAVAAIGWLTMRD